MEQSHQTEILSQLYLLKDHLPEGDVEEKYVDNFNSILIGLPYDLPDCRIPDEMLSRRKTRTDLGRFYIGGETKDHYSTVSYCDRAYFLERIDKLIRLLKRWA